MARDLTTAHQHENGSRKRRKIMETHRTTSFDDAEEWDLDYWQRRTPANWIDLDNPRHLEDARVLRAVRDRRKNR